MTLGQRVAAAVAVAALGGAAIGAAVTGGSASATAAQTDGLYACSFTGAEFGCTPTVVPTPTVTETVTATPAATVSVSPTPTVTPTPSPTPSNSTTLTGTSYPGLGSFPTAKAVRFFWPGAPSTALPATPAGAAVFVSFKALPSDAAFVADLAAWAASGRQVFWTYYHEADSGALSPAAYQAGWAQLLADEHAHPALNVHSLTILMAYAFQRGNVEAYFVPGVDFLGFDCYQLGNEQKAIDYAAAKGKRLVFGEIGNVTALNGANTDAAALAYAKAFWAALTPNVVAAIWWSGPPDNLANLPQTAAYLKARP